MIEHIKSYFEHMHIILGIKTLVNNNPSIRCMNIDGCHKLYDDVFAVIAQGLRGSLVIVVSCIDFNRI